MTIKVYNSIMPGEPDEVYQDHGITVEQWVKSQTPDYQRGDCQPISCMINGAIVKPMDWADALIGEGDNVEFRVVPRGGALDFLAVVFPTIFGPIVGPQIAIEALIDIPGQPQGQGQQGQRLNPADARANTARPGAGIPEGFGEYIRYPDYIAHPRRYYVDKRTQALDLTLCIGVGEYQIDHNTVKIGDTPVSELGNVVSYAIHQPGEAIPATFKNWYPSPEVGASTGSAGIRLLGLPEGTIEYSDLSASSDTDTISNIETSEYWKAGYTVAVDIYQPVTVTSDPAGDILAGQFQHLSVGQQVFIKEQDGSFGSTYPSGLLARVLTMNASNTEMTLEDTSGTPAPIIDIDPGTYSADVANNLVSFKVASTTDTSLTLAAEDNLGNPVSPSLPTVSADEVNLSFLFNDFTEVWSGPFRATPSAEISDTFEIDIFAPQGLGVIDGSTINSRTRTIEIQYRAPGTSTWISTTRDISGATRDQLGWTFEVSFVNARELEVRVRRTDAEDISTTSLDRIEWTGLRAELPRANSYSGVTTMTMTIEGSDQLASQSENRINLEFVRKLPEISGGVFTAPVATRKISAAACYVAKSLGYDDDQLDLDEFERLETIWTSRGDTFNYVFADGTAKDAIDTILRAGFAEMTIDRGIISPVRDEPRTTLEQGYSPENMTTPLRRQFNGRQPDEPDGVEVEYTKAGTWTTETVKCLLPGDQQIKLDKIKLNGVTDETRAWRIGMRRRRAQRYRRWTYSFETELDALNSSYLSYVPLLDDIPGYGKVCILEDIQSDRIVVSEPVEFIDGETHVVAYREADGTVAGPFTATQGPDDYTILVTIPQPWPEVLSATQENTHVYFGTTDRWHFPALITEINPSGPLSVSVTASNYDARVYDDDDSSPP